MSNLQHFKKILGKEDVLANSCIQLCSGKNHSVTIYLFLVAPDCVRTSLRFRPGRSFNTDDVILSTVIMFIAFRSIFLPKEKYHWSFEQAQPVGSVTATRLGAPSPSLTRFHRAICPRCLADRLVLSQCSYLCHRQCSEPRNNVSIVTKCSTPLTFLSKLKAVRTSV